MGIPVVCGQATGALAWMTDGGQAGMLVDVTSADSILDALRQLHRNPQHYEALAVRGRALAAQRFSAGAIADQYLGAYGAILAP